MRTLAARSLTSLAWLTLLGLAAVVAPRPARAQLPGAPMFSTLDLGAVAVGKWAAYTITDSAAPAMSMRVALVSKSAAGNVLEMSLEPLAKTTSAIVLQATMAPDQKDPRLTKMAMQIGTLAPMEMPQDERLAKVFTSPDPKALVGQETITVPAGKLKTKHYRDKSPQGDVIDFWMSERAPPLGLVKVEGTKGDKKKSKFNLELVGTGGDAKAVVTQRARPYNQAEYVQMLISVLGMSGTAQQKK